MSTKIAYAGIKVNYPITQEISKYDGKHAVSNSLNVPETIVEFPLIDLHFSAKKLSIVSDPMLVMFISENGKWIEADRTEYLQNEINPTWVKNMTVMYVFEHQQPLVFRFIILRIKIKDLRSKI